MLFCLLYNNKSGLDNKFMIWLHGTNSILFEILLEFYLKYFLKFLELKDQDTIVHWKSKIHRVWFSLVCYRSIKFEDKREWMMWSKINLGKKRSRLWRDLQEQMTCSIHFWVNSTILWWTIVKAKQIFTTQE